MYPFRSTAPNGNASTEAEALHVTHFQKGLVVAISGSNRAVRRRVTYAALRRHPIRRSLIP